jgi:large-conductance mechanosensitive channel
MGNQQFKCPAETTNGAAPLSCVMSCPTGFELRMVDGAQRCVSTVDSNVTVHLTALAAVPRTIGDNSSFSISDLQESHPDEYTRYSAEEARFTHEMDAAKGQISHDAEIAAAATALQNAAPGEATDLAKAKYMELTSDPDTAAYAADKAAGAAAQKEVDRFVSEYQFLANQATQQQSTLDLIRGVKDKLLTVKDDMEFSVGTFGKQVEDIRNQININKRKREQATDYGKWLSMALNVAIVAALVFALFVFGRKAMGNMGTVPSSSSGAPSRPPATEETNALFGALGKYLASANPAK